jgi:NADH-quinone oxidoreductase subunit J
MNVILAGPSVLEKIAFVVFAVGVLGGALVTITRKSAVAALIALVGTSCALAGLYATLSAHFLAILQILVYAGAIMVLFIFAVMIVNRDDEHPIALRGLFVRAAGVLATGYLFYRVAWIVVRERQTDVLGTTITLPIPDYGNVASIGRLLFTDFLFPFEAISLLLLAAVVAGVLISRPSRPTTDMGTLGGLASHSAPTPSAPAPALPPSGASGPTPPLPPPLASLAPSRAASPNPPATVRADEGEGRRPEGRAGREVGPESSAAPHATNSGGAA